MFLFQLRVARKCMAGHSLLKRDESVRSTLGVSSAEECHERAGKLTTSESSAPFASHIK